MTLELYPGYLNLGGNEIINNERTRAILESLDCPVPWFKDDDYRCASLLDALGTDGTSIADAPWYDLDLATVSGDFYGAYAIIVESTSDSTRQVNVAESILNGGTIGRTRLATRSVRVQALLFAKNSAGLDYGRSWLDSATMPGACGQHSTRCGVTDLAFFASCPPARGTVTEYGPWETQARNVFPNPRATDLAPFGGLTTNVLVTDFPDAEVPTAVRSTRPDSANTIRAFELHVAAADFPVDGSPVRVLFTVRASEAASIMVSARPQFTTDADESVIGSFDLEPGVTVIDVTGASPTGGTAAEGFCGYVISTPPGTPTGLTLDVTKVLIQNAPTVVVPWFDGASTPPVGNVTTQYLWEGAAEESPSVYQTRTAVQVPEPVEDWEEKIAEQRRYLHAVGVTSGPFTVEEYRFKSNDFVAQMVEFTVTSERAYVYGETRTVELPTTNSTVVQDIPFNLVPYPSAELAGDDVVTATNYSTNPSVEVNTTGWSMTSTAVSGTAPAAYLTSGRTTELASAGTASFRARLLGNATTGTVTDAVGQVSLLQTVSLTAVDPAVRMSFNLWTAAIVSAGTAVSEIQSVEVVAQFRDAAAATISEVPMVPATSGGFDGRVYQLKSTLIPAGSVDVRVIARTQVKWSSSATAANNSDIRIYADALAVTVP